MQVPFVKGHCGWDTVTLVPSGYIPHDREREIALRMLAAPFHGGLEVGFLGPGGAPDELRLRVIDSTSRDWISMCGGMTQVIGKALVETSFRQRFGCDPPLLARTLRLQTDSSVVPIEIQSDGTKATRVTTVMDGYAAFMYRMGVSPVTIGNVAALETGDFIVFDISDLEKHHPRLDFTRRDPGRHLDVVNDLLREYRGSARSGTGVNCMLYDARPQGPGSFRVFPRLFSDDLSAATIPYEYQCGTGTVAVGIALVEKGLLRSGEVILEWGNLKVTPDPYGVRTSHVCVEVVGGRLSGVRFSHSTVEILAEGMLTLPDDMPTTKERAA